MCGFIEQKETGPDQSSIRAKPTKLIFTKLCDWVQQGRRTDPLHFEEDPSNVVGP